MFSEQLEHFFGFFGVDLEEENSNIFESLFLSTSNFANFRIPNFVDFYFGRCLLSIQWDMGHKLRIDICTNLFKMIFF